MGKGGNERSGSGEEENMAAWLVGIDTLKIQPFKLPALGLFLSFFLFTVLLIFGYIIFIFLFSLILTCFLIIILCMYV